MKKLKENITDLNVLENVSGGGMLWNEYAKYILHIMDTGARSSLVDGVRCPYCGWKLELIKKSEVSTAEESFVVENQMITCHGCGMKSPGDAWFQLKGERRELLT